MENFRWIFVGFMVTVGGHVISQLADFPHDAGLVGIAILLFGIAIDIAATKEATRK